MPKLRSSLTAKLALLVLLVGQTVGAQSAPKPGAANPAGVKTEPHRAAYAFSLKRARSDSGMFRNQTLEVLFFPQCYDWTWVGILPLPDPVLCRI